MPYLKLSATKQDASKLDNLLNNKNNVVFVRFYSHGCGFCVAMQKEFDNVFSELKHKNSNTYVVDAEVNIASYLKHSVRGKVMGSGVPLMILFYKGHMKEYNGERTRTAMANFIEKHTSGMSGGRRKKSKTKSKTKSKRKHKLKRKTHKRTINKRKRKSKSLKHH